MAFLQSMLEKISFRGSELPALSPPADISERIQHFMPLYRLQEQKQLIEVTCETTGEVFQSLILGIDLLNETVDLDELFPQPAFAIEPGDRFIIRHHRDGKVLSFSTTLEAVDYGDGVQIYTFHLPETLLHKQRRRHPRVSISPRQPLTVRLQSPWRTPWFATAKNISASGMRLTLGGNALDQLRPGAIIPRCEFEFNPEFRFRCQAQVRAFKFLRRPYRHTDISIQFLDMPAVQAKALEQFLFTLTPQDQAAA